MSKRMTYRPRLESLESRLPLAGNVTAELSGGQLTILGDSADNDIVVVQSGDTVTITGNAGTTINGAPAAAFTTSGLEKAEFKMESGDDHLFLINVDPSGDVVVEMGDGNDIAEASNVDAGANFTIKSGKGDDLVGVANSSAGGDMNVEFEGKATLFLTRLNVTKNLSVDTDGDDQISIDGVITVGEDLTVSTGKGNDVVTVADLVTAAPVSVGKSLRIDTDRGNDRVNLVDVVVGEDIYVNTGKGNDTATLTDVSSGKSLSVNTDDGNDRVTATNVSAAVDAIFAGGAGFDIFDDNGVFGGVKLELKEFESII
jgi:hypothetical protein